ncbi:uncharacterized protein LOC109600546 [Aethina tumida]|uniref:uncharacterized protein LOC109600546 n=1 Tax=Aethina tumida TaxID=116153 RepID=UPI00214962B6|nr:uncharacterized protein LOC109600546 [Aethina tumida]
MANSLQGVYSPLPQNLSDSDSEKEISMEPVCGNYGNSGLSNNFSRNSYRQNGHLNFHNASDEVLKVKRVNPKMSTMRKAAFVCSILLCFLPVIIFLWVLPCSDSNTCPIKISNWEYQQEDIEFKGKVNVVHGAFKKNLNLAILYKGSKLSTTVKNGVISFLGSSGAVAWDFHQEPDPISMDCSIIDIDGNGLNDCLILDDKGLKAIETVSGTVIWHVQSSESKGAISDLSSLVKLTDFNNDGVTEFLTVYEGKSFLIVCGKTGQALIKIKTNCNNITDVTLNKDMVNYSCLSDAKFYEILLDNFRQKYKDPTFTIKPTKQLGKNKEQIYVLGNRKLIVNNNGKCPECYSIVTLHTDTEKQLKTWNYKGYIMKPVTFTFQSTKSNVATLKGHLNGFILKLWDWMDSKKMQNPFKKSKRSLPLNNDTSIIYRVTERVMLITFNSTDIRLINASMVDITQICLKEEKEDYTCQPDHKNQEDSLLIADLDQDHSQELISHTSTYLNRSEGGKESWYLMSYLKVFRLEGELPKMYKPN